VVTTVTYSVMSSLYLSGLFVIHVLKVMQNDRDFKEVIPLYHLQYFS